MEKHRKMVDELRGCATAQGLGTVWSEVGKYTAANGLQIKYTDEWYSAMLE